MDELKITSKEIETAAALNATFCPAWFWSNKRKKREIAKRFAREMFECEAAKNWNHKIKKDDQGNFWISWGRGFLIYLTEHNGFVQRKISKTNKPLCDQFEARTMKAFVTFFALQ